MIKCNKCGNVEKFSEVHVGGKRVHNYTQEKNGRFIFDGSDYDKCDDTLFQCANCGANLGHQYRAFLQALFAMYNEKIHGV